MGQNVSVGKSLITFLYLFLVLILSYLTYQGPIVNYLKNETTYLESRIQASSLNLPSVLLCQYPGFKSNFTSKEIHDLTFYNNSDLERLSAIYDNLLNVTDVINSLGLMTIAGKYKQLSLQHWQYLPVDLAFVGQCFYLHSSLFKDSFLKGEFDILVIGLGTTSSRIPLSAKTISMQFLEEQELGLLGFSMEELGSDSIPIDLGTATDYQLRMKKVTRIRECQPDRGRSLSQCLAHYKDKEYPMCKWDDLLNNTCTNVTHYVNRLSHSFMRKTYEAIRNETGCLLPCDRVQFSTRIALKTKLVQDLNDPRHTSIHIQLNMGDRVIHLTEQLAFNLYDLASGFGGLAGLFLGWSLWGCFKHVRKAVKVLAHHEDKSSTVSPISRDTPKMP